MDSFDFIYDPIISFDDKWQTLDIKEIIQNEEYNKLWNAMINDGEIFYKNSAIRNNKSGVIAKKGISGKFYCGRQILNCKCCNGNCGPSNGCNCDDCADLDNCLSELSALSRPPKPMQLFASWDWSELSDSSQIKKSLKSCFYEQHLRSRNNILSLNYYSNLLRRSIVFDRFIQSLGRKKLDLKKVEMKRDKISFSSERTERADSSPTENLGRVGSNALLKFLFSFLSRSWRSIQDADLCGDLLGSTLEAISSLPLASLSDTSQLSPMWINIIDKLEQFLISIVDSEKASTFRNLNIPKSDKQLAVALLFELSIQKGKLSEVLSTILFLLRLSSAPSSTGTLKSESRRTKELQAAPIGSALKRFEEMLEEVKSTVNGKDAFLPSVTQCYINSLSIPPISTGNTPSINLQTSSILIMAFLERIAHFKLSHIAENLNKAYCQELYAWTLSKYSQSKSFIRNVEGIGFIKQMLPFYHQFLILTQTGIVYLLKLDPLGQDDLSQLNFDGKLVVKISSSEDSMHMLAITDDGKVYSYGKAYHGQLGFLNNTELIEPMRIEFLSSKYCVSISCSKMMSAMVTKDGRLYICGQMKPASSIDLDCGYVEVDVDFKVVDVICGSNGCAPIFINSKGWVYRFNDDYTCSLVEIKTENVKKIFSFKAGYSGALTDNGILHIWDRNYFVTKLCHIPNGEIVKDCVSLGNWIYIVIESGRIYRVNMDDMDEYGEVEALRFDLLKDLTVDGICCTNQQNYAWTCKKENSKEDKMHFVIDNDEKTFKCINLLLDFVFDFIDGKAKWPPNQDKECLAIATISILNNQLKTSKFVGHAKQSFGSCSCILHSICQQLISLATAPNVLNTIQSLAQQVLTDSWSVLLSYIEDRLKILSLLIPLLEYHDISNEEVSSGCKFLLSFLSRILDDDIIATGLETAYCFGLHSQLLKERSLSSPETRYSPFVGTSVPHKLDKLGHDIINKSISLESMKRAASSNIAAGANLAASAAINSANTSAFSSLNTSLSNLKIADDFSFDLFDILKQLLRNSTMDILNQLNTSKVSNISNEKNCITDLILKIQRSLFVKLLSLNIENQFPIEPEVEANAAGEFLNKYMNILCNNFLEIINLTSKFAKKKDRHTLAQLLVHEPTVKVFSELLMGLQLLIEKHFTIVNSSNIISLLHSVLSTLNSFLLKYPSLHHLETQMLNWPGLFNKINKNENRKVDFITQSNMDDAKIFGEHWVIFEEGVYDVTNFKCNENINFQQLAGTNITNLLYKFPRFYEIREQLEKKYLGEYFADDQEICMDPLESFFFSNLLSISSQLGLLISSIYRILYVSTPLSSEEEAEKYWLDSPLFHGGHRVVYPSNAFDEEKGDGGNLAAYLNLCRSVDSEKCEQDGNWESKRKMLLEEEAHQLPQLHLLEDVLKHDLTRPVTRNFFDQLTTHNAKFSFNSPIKFSPDHPVEDVCRHILAVLLKHLGLGDRVFELFDNWDKEGPQLSEQHLITEICRVVGQSRCKLIKIHQDTGFSYKEVCQPIVEKCNFLFYELLPAIQMSDCMRESKSKKIFLQKSKWIMAAEKIWLSQSSDKSFEKVKLKNEKYNIKKMKDSNVQIKDGTNAEYRQSLLNMIVEFVFSNSCIIIENLRKCLAKQAIRAEYRLTGLQGMLQLFQNFTSTCTTSQISIMIGWLNLLQINRLSTLLDKSTKPSKHLPPCLSDIVLIPPCDLVLLEYANMQLNHLIVNKMQSILVCKELNVLKEAKVVDEACLKKTSMILNMPLLMLLLGCLNSQHRDASLSALIHDGLFAHCRTISRLFKTPDDFKTESLKKEDILLSESDMNIFKSLDESIQLDDNTLNSESQSILTEGSEITKKKKVPTATLR